MNKKKRVRALVLFSGGLDSILAAKILQKQDIEVLALTFVSYFFNGDKAKETAKKNGIEIMERDISKLHLEKIKNPRFGKGRAMNPCIDCHLLMIQEAGKIMKEKGLDFVATGEVLGQRPMSQNKQALEIVERNSGICGKLLRPLSAQLLEETQVEKKGLVNRNKLAALSGRSRKKQIELANELGVTYYPSPSGGCVLTEREYGGKLEKLLENFNEPEENDFGLLQIGRQFWQDGIWFILGKNKEENESLEKALQKRDVLIFPGNFSGPSALLRGKDINDKIIEEAKNLVLKYTKKLEVPPKFIIKR